MKTKESVEKGLAFRSTIADLLREGKVLSIHDMNAMAREWEIPLGISNKILLQIQGGAFFKLTGVRVEKIRLNSKQVLLADASLDSRETNLKEKLQAMLVDDKGKPVKEYLRTTIDNIATKHNISFTE